MAEHTPGPWAYEDDGDTAIDVYSAETHFLVAPVWYYGDLSDKPQAEADARLMAAAPEMLECLKVFLAPDDLTAWDIGVWMEQARLVVAKAEGKQP